MKTASKKPSAKTQSAAAPARKTAPAKAAAKPAPTLADENVVDPLHNLLRGFYAHKVLDARQP
jgi:hypothetical protein